MNVAAYKENHPAQAAARFFFHGSRQALDAPIEENPINNQVDQPEVEVVEPHGGVDGDDDGGGRAGVDGDVEQLRAMSAATGIERSMNEATTENR